MAGIQIRQSQKATLKQSVKPWVQLQTIIRHKLLVKTNLELRVAVEEELRENPALEVVEEAERERQLERTRERQDEKRKELREEYEATRQRKERGEHMDDMLGASSGQYEDPEAGFYRRDEEEYDPLTNTSNRAGDIRQQLTRGYRLTYPGASREELTVADALIDLIQSDGLIHIDLVELASDLNVPLREVQRVQWQLTQTDPPGIGASAPQQALLAQMAYLRATDSHLPLELPERILRDHYHLILEGRVSHLPRELGVSSRQVEDALHFIAENLFPYPGELLPGSLGTVERNQGIGGPDVIIRAIPVTDGEPQYFVEVQDAGLPRMRISKWYQDAYSRIKAGTTGEFSTNEKEHIQNYFDRAYWFLENLSTRSETLRKVTEALIGIQGAYLTKGVLGLQPLTQEDLAKVVGVHPSTISRALNGKFVQLPDARLVPFTVFFDYQQVVIEVIRNILGHETPEKMFSDQAISVELTRRGYEVARRTVAKYRDIGSIPPKGQRKRALLRERTEAHASGGNPTTRGARLLAAEAADPNYIEILPPDPPGRDRFLDVEDAETFAPGYRRSSATPQPEVTAAE